MNLSDIATITYLSMLNSFMAIIQNVRKKSSFFSLTFAKFFVVWLQSPKGKQVLDYLKFLQLNCKIFKSNASLSNSFTLSMTDCHIMFSLCFVVLLTLRLYPLEKTHFLSIHKNSAKTHFHQKQISGKLWMTFEFCLVYILISVAINLRRHSQCQSTGISLCDTHENVIHFLYSSMHTWFLENWIHWIVFLKIYLNNYFY